MVNEPSRILLEYTTARVNESFWSGNAHTCTRFSIPNDNIRVATFFLSNFAKKPSANSFANWIRIPPTTTGDLEIISEEEYKINPKKSQANSKLCTAMQTLLLT